MTVTGKLYVDNLFMTVTAFNHLNPALDVCSGSSVKVDSHSLPFYPGTLKLIYKLWTELIELAKRRKSKYFVSVPRFVSFSDLYIS